MSRAAAGSGTHASGPIGTPIVRDMSQIPINAPFARAPTAYTIAERAKTTGIDHAIWNPRQG